LQPLTRRTALVSVLSVIFATHSTICRYLGLWSIFYVLGAGDSPTLRLNCMTGLAFLTSKLRFEFSFVFVLVFIVHSFWITFQVPLLHERERRNAFSLLKE